jgi:uncharacterized membrane protein
MRRTAVVAVVGLAAGLVLLRFSTWELATIGGWDAAALAFLAIVWPLVLRADGARTALIASREDETRGSATVLLVGASVSSLVGAGFALEAARHETGRAQVLLIAVAILTVLVSWTVVNTVYTLRYADLHYGSTAAGIDFGGGDGGGDAAARGRPSYLDFAYVAFTIGMTYQVSDTTLRDSRMRRTVLAHAALSYLFGVVIVGGSVNLVAGLVR